MCLVISVQACHIHGTQKEQEQEKTPEATQDIINC